MKPFGFMCKYVSNLAPQFMIKFWCQEALFLNTLSHWVGSSWPHARILGTYDNKSTATPLSIVDATTNSLGILTDIPTDMSTGGISAGSVPTGVIIGMVLASIIF